MWSKLRIKLEKPKIDFIKSCLVVIQPGNTITQYNYNVFFKEDSTSIKIILDVVPKLVAT